MNRSTTFYIALGTLVLGSGLSGIFSIWPALNEQAQLKQTKLGLEAQGQTLKARSDELKAELERQAKERISFFDLSTSLNKRREMESKTVQTLASLTEIFNDHRVSIQALEPNGETVGTSKPVPSAAPVADGAASPSPSPSPAPGTATPPPPINLTHKQYKFLVRGEYGDIVKAMTEIQGLPKAISINQYDIQLLTKGEGKQAENDRVKDVSPTLLELSFQLSITFLLDGGPVPAPAAQGAASPATVSLLDRLLGGVAEAAEASLAAVAVPAPLPSVEAGRPSNAKVPRRYTGVTYQGGALFVQTAGGTPPYTMIGLGRQRAQLDLVGTRLGGGPAATAVGQGGIRRVTASEPRPGVVRLIIETDGTSRLEAKLDRFERLQLVAAPRKPLPRVAALPAAARTAVRPQPTSRLGDVRFEQGELRVQTQGPAPRFEVLGGHKNRLVVELDGTAIKAPGKVFPIDAAGIKQVRAVLYRNRPMITRLVIDTDGSVRLSAYRAPDGALRLRVTPIGAPATSAAHPVKAAVAPLKPVGKPAVVAAAPAAPRGPKAAPTPMAVPARAAAVPAKPHPSAFPEDAANEPAEGRRLVRSLSSHYSFPIDREKVTGRANPFKVLPRREKPQAAKPGLPAPIPLPAFPGAGAPPVLPPPGLKGTLPPPAALPAAPPKAYALQAVMTGGGAPLAVIQVDGKAHVVGLNEFLPGNARVKSIQSDYIVVTANGQDMRIGLKK